MYVANWKMNGSLPKIETWLKGIGKSLDKSLQKECVFCPPSCYLFQAAEIIKNENLKIFLGAQDIDPNYKKPLTGGINASMVKELGCDYVIIGHSERRQVFKENNEDIKIKASQLLDEKIIPIICIGETLEQKKMHKTHEVLKEQVINSLPPNSSKESVIIAYEPIWAIGTGMTASLEEINDIHEYL